MRENIVELLCGDKQIYLVKTAHVSKTSIEDVDACFEEVKPDSICIELDEQRYQKLENPEAWRETDGWFYWNYQLLRDRTVPTDLPWKESWDLCRCIRNGWLDSGLLNR